MSRRESRLTAFAVAGLVAATTLSFAQQQGQGSQNQRAVSNQDMRFVEEAAAGGMMEVELGRLAAQRAVSDDVKTFAQRMVEDHTRANQQLLQVATRIGVTLPQDLPADKKSHRDMLAQATGTEFDRAYMSHMVKDHEKTVKDFQQQAQKGDNQAVRTFAQQTLPTLRQHLELAQSLAAQVGAQDHGGHHDPGNP